MWLKRAGVCVAVALAGYAGARWQATQQAVRTETRPPVQLSRAGESAQLQGGLADLAIRVGKLQGRLAAMEALAARVAETAGLDYTAPELVPAPRGVADRGAGGDRSGPSAGRSAGPGTAEELGRHMDRLTRRLARQEDAYSLVGSALSRQSGRQAALPTAAPVDYPYLSSSFGWRRHPVNGRQAMHEGLDFVAPRGAGIRAASGGMVVRAGPVRGYGRMVEIDHGNGLRTRYAHASRVLVRAGDIVRQGDLIARVGSTGRSTGTHLHFEIRMADYPLDPTLFIHRGVRTLTAGGEMRLTQEGRVGHAGG